MVMTNRKATFACDGKSSLHLKIMHGEVIFQRLKL